MTAHAPSGPTDGTPDPDPAVAGSMGVPHDVGPGPGAEVAGAAGDGGTARPGEWRPPRWSREALDLLPDLARLLRALVADPRVPRRAKVVAAAAAAYVASPVDLLPDLIPNVGGLDDLVVVFGAVRYLVATAGYDLVRELWTGNDAGFSLVIVFAGVDR